MDKLKQIESFVAVAVRGSLTAAALAEGVAPAIIGRRLDALEARLGVKLLVRTTRRISPEYSCAGRSVSQVAGAHGLASVQIRDACAPSPSTVGGSSGQVGT
jgi:hypothetical protein